MKAIVINKKHLTLVSHTNGVVIVEESGCIIDLDFQSLGSIFELADLGNTYTIKDCDEIETLKADNNELTERVKFLEGQLTNSSNRITELRSEIIGLDNELNIRRERISQLNNEIETLKADNCKETVLDKYENDIVDFNVSAMDIYYIHEASPNVVRKFNYDNFNISCKDQRTANTINTLLNCSNISVYDIMDRFKDDIAYSNTH